VLQVSQTALCQFSWNFYHLRGCHLLLCAKSLGKMNQLCGKGKKTFVTPIFAHREFGFSKIFYPNMGP